MSMFDEKISTQLKKILDDMESDVTMLYFTQEIECNTCRNTHQFVDEMSELSGKLKLTVYDFQKDSSAAEKYSVDKIPAIVFLDSQGKDRGIKFYGLPGGYEINSFLHSVNEISGRKEPLSPEVSDRILKIDKDIHIQVFVTLT